MTTIEIKNILLKRLKKFGAIDWHESLNGSCYIKFYDDRLGQCRVGNHDEKGGLGYRWQVRSDIKEKYTSRKKGHNQFIYPSSDLEGLVLHISNYLNKIKTIGDEFKCV